MLFTNRRAAYALLWLLNHIPFYRNRFQVEVIHIELDPSEGEAEWSPEQQMQLTDILKDSE